MNGLIEFITALRKLQKQPDDTIIFDWLELAGNLTDEEDLETALYQKLAEIRHALEYVKNNFSSEVLQKSLRLCILEDEIINGAVCLNAGYSLEEVKELADSGNLMGGYTPIADDEIGTLLIMRFIDLDNKLLLVANEPKDKMEAVINELAIVAEKDSHKIYQSLIAQDCPLRIVRIGGTLLEPAYLQSFETTTAVGRLFRYSFKTGIESICCPVSKEQKLWLDGLTDRQSVVEELVQEYNHQKL